MTDLNHNEEDCDEAFVSAVESVHEQLMQSGEIQASGDKQSSQRKLQRVLPVLQLLEELKGSRGHAGPSPQFMAIESTCPPTSENESKSQAGVPDITHVFEDRKLGRFRIISQIGRGGYGIVFRARDPKLGRDVAIKIPRLDAALSADARRRFIRESTAAAGLNHPGIVTVFETGSERGIDYLVTEFIEGENLANRLARGERWTARSSAKMVLQIVEAVSHAHDNGVLHRDIKSSNVLISDHEPESAKIADFGLALQEDDLDQTQSGALIGTPACMSPEQATGDHDLIGPSTDVYGIGTVLYQLITGIPPFHGRSVVETLRMICERDPESPRRIDPSCPRDLEAICLKCLEKLPSRRYSKADDLADDLHRFLRGEPVSARSPTLVTRLAKWCNRHPVFALAVLLGAALAIAGPLVAINQSQLYRAAENAREDLNRSLYMSDVNLAFRDWEDANIERCGLLLRRHIPDNGQADYRKFEWFYLWDQWHHGDQTPTIIHDSQLDSIALSRDETVLAVGCFDGEIYLWDLEQNKELIRWKAHSYRVKAIAFSRDGQRIATTNVDQEVRIWDLNSGRQIASIEGRWTLDVSFQDQVVYASDNHSIGVVDFDGNNTRILPVGHEIRSLATHPRRPLVATAGWDGVARIVDTVQGQIVNELPGETASLWTIDWSPDGQFIAAGDVAGGIHVWNVDGYDKILEIDAHSTTVYQLHFSENSQFIASGSTDSRIKIWKLTEDRAVTTLQGHFGEVKSVVFDDGGSVLYSAGIDGQVKRWDLATAPAQTVLEHPDSVFSVDLSDDAGLIATSCSDGKARLWNVQTHELIHEIDAHSGHCWETLFLHHDDQLNLVTSGSDDRVRLWSTTAGELLAEIPCRAVLDDPLPLAVSPDQTQLALADGDYSAAIYDLDSMNIKHRFGVGSVDAFAFSPDGNLLATSVGGKVLVFDCESGEEICNLAGDVQNVPRLRFTIDGQMLAAGCYDRTIKLWSTSNILDNDALVMPDKVIRGQSSIVDALEFSRRDLIMASGGDDRIIRLWDQDTGQQRAALKGHQGGIADLQFSADGEVLVSASLDRTVRIWNAPRR